MDCSGKFAEYGWIGARPLHLPSQFRPENACVLVDGHLCTTNTPDAGGQIKMPGNSFPNDKIRRGRNRIEPYFSKHPQRPMWRAEVTRINGILSNDLFDQQGLLPGIPGTRFQYDMRPRHTHVLRCGCHFACGGNGLQPGSPRKQKLAFGYLPLDTDPLGQARRTPLSASAAPKLRLAVFSVAFARAFLKTALRTGRQA
ncbi:hypothetical protein D3OALGA1CA_373 [Olavius algarvensis associated proteobacterium Delta 3]|nr:hypothetical protein D3OALGA1CA_373 [Olavius algarvensis associated proteobacterium Delta 3]